MRRNMKTHLPSLLSVTAVSSCALLMPHPPLIRLWIPTNPDLSHSLPRAAGSGNITSLKPRAQMGRSDDAPSLPGTVDMYGKYSFRQARGRQGRPDACLWSRPPTAVGKWDSVHIGMYRSWGNAAWHPTQWGQLVVMGYSLSRWLPEYSSGRSRNIRPRVAYRHDEAELGRGLSAWQNRYP